MNDLIQRLTNAIFRQEGMPADYKNPGNCRYAPWLQHPSLAKGFWQPDSRAQGIAGASHVVSLHIAMGNNLEQLISGWAPPNENDTAAYIEHVKEWALIPDSKVPLFNYILETPIPT